MSRTSHGIYKIRKLGGGADGPQTFGISLPTPMVEQVPEGTIFQPEWHEDGILLRLVETPPEPPPLPAWLNGSAS